ncbi:MAG: c-type cytochrome [Bacteroidia bacterium]|jgi:cytochrome c oxidase cbb3-type subunit III|nr:c-type cytochrome [Sphingobacteriaceae bacterium]MBP9068133.1 c-type cytochrome [Bacteroidia bacterium]
MKKLLNKNKLSLLAIILFPAITFAQQVESTNKNTYFSNSLFLTLLVLILFLLIIIVGLSQVLKNISSGDYLSNKMMANKKEDPNTNTKLGSLVFLMFLGHQASAANIENGDWTVGGLDMSTFYFMLGVIGLELVVIIAMYFTFRNLLGSAKDLEALKGKVKSKTILEKINASIDIEEEKDILLDHDYDGIKELDNDLPPWWKYGFYVTIIIAVIYMINFHVSGTGDLQIAEYNKEVAKAKLEVAEYMKTAANNVDETNIKQLEGADVEEGKNLFVVNCAACHGKDGQGSVGPNLVDNYWLHGGSLVDVFKSIKYGWIDKGMKAWKDDFSPMQIAQISSFIRTIVGTNPTGAKAPQGDLYQEGEVPITDSVIVANDSMVVKKDTLK